MTNSDLGGNMNLNKLKQFWKSPIVPRDKIGGFSGGRINPRTLADLDCKGQGPPSFRFGRKVAYDVD